MDANAVKVCNGCYQALTQPNDVTFAMLRLGFTESRSLLRHKRRLVGAKNASAARQTDSNRGTSRPAEAGASRPAYGLRPKVVISRRCAANGEGRGMV